MNKIAYLKRLGELAEEMRSARDRAAESARCRICGYGHTYRVGEIEARLLAFASTEPEEAE